MTSRGDRFSLKKLFGSFPLIMITFTNFLECSGSVSTSCHHNTVTIEGSYVFSNICQLLAF